MDHSDPFAVRAILGPRAAVARRAVTGEHGVALPPLHDHHVHAHLVDLSRLPGHGIAAVVDLGGDPVALARHPQSSMPVLAYAGAFLTAPGGYPHGRSWAPDAIVRQLVAEGGLGTPGGIETAVDEQATFGASLIKVSLNAAAGPVLTREQLGAVVAAAHARGLPVVAHAEGVGMAERAIEAEVDAMAHAPFSESLAERLVAVAAASQVWISTLDIHRSSSADRARAIANLAAFAALGGRVLYGTDLGNGNLPLGVNARELRCLHDAGLAGAALIDALTDPWPATEAPSGVATFVAGAPPETADDVPDWLRGAVVVPSEELIRDVH